jgi:hypothetical protein
LFSILRDLKNMSYIQLSTALINATSNDQWLGHGGGGGFEPPLASRKTPGIRAKPQRNYFWER